MAASKLTHAYKYRHFGLFVPKANATPLALSALMHVYPCAPFRETDSSRITHHLVEPVIVLAYAATELAPWKCTDLPEWRFFPIEQNDTYEITNEVSQALVYRFEARQPVGTKIGQPLRYQHGVIARPTRYREFPVDCMRYDRLFFANLAVAEQAQQTLEGQAVKEVYLLEYSEISKPKVTDDMWHSFGWSVEPVPYWEMVRRMES